MGSIQNKACEQDRELEDLRARLAAAERDMEEHKETGIDKGEHLEFWGASF